MFPNVLLPQPDSEARVTNQIIEIVAVKLTNGVRVADSPAGLLDSMNGLSIWAACTGQLLERSK